MAMSKDEFYAKIEELIKKEIAQKGIDNTDVKLEDFDFAELVSDLTNSVTDQLYREFFPPAKNIYEERLSNGNDTNFRNDLDVSEIVEELRGSLIKDIRERVTISVRSRMGNELEEQYHPKVGSTEHKVDQRLKSIRNFAIGGYYCVGLIMLAVVALVATETVAIIIKTGYLIVEGAQNFLNEEYVDTVNRTTLNKIIFSILSVLDLLLLASLIVMVLIGGYENTVSRIGTSHDVPTWFGSLGITDLKIKVAASIVIISSIHLLTQFMLIEPTMPGYLTPNYQKLVACNSNVQSMADQHSVGQNYTGLTRDAITQIERAYETCRVAQLEKEKIAMLKSAGINSADDYFEGAFSPTALMWTSIVHAVFVLAALVLAYIGWLSSSEKKKAEDKTRQAVIGRREPQSDPNLTQT